MKTWISDAALCYKMLEDTLVGLCATYVDDTLHTGNERYAGLCKETEKNFKCKN